MDEKFWYLKNSPLFLQLREEEVRRLERVSQAKAFARGSLVYMPADAGESVFLVTGGRIKLYHLTAEGKQALLAFVDPGEIFGELAVFDSGPRDEFAEAMENSTLIRIPKTELQALIEAHASVAVGITKLMGFRRRRIERRLKSLLFRSNRERLIHLLVELAERYGRRTPQGVVLGIKLSHQELANIIGSTRETVTVVLGELQKEGSLVIRRRQIVLTALDRLARSAEMPPPALPEQSPLFGQVPNPAGYRR